MNAAVPTLILPPRFAEDSTAVWRAAVEAGWNVERLAGWRCPADLQAAQPVVYGEPLFAAVVAEALNFVLLEPPFDWLATLPDQWRRRNVRATTLKEARVVPAPAFIKPADDKCFRARVYPSGAEVDAHSSVPDTTPVLISEPVEWEVEVRCFVLDRKVMTLSPYARFGQLAMASDGSWPISEVEAAAADAFVSGLLSDVRVAVPPGVVIDIGSIAGRGWAVVEANPAFGAGIYGCDATRVLPVIARACVPREALQPHDSRWVLNR